jgi:hypothetical protein
MQSKTQSSKNKNNKRLKTVRSQGEVILTLSQHILYLENSIKEMKDVWTFVSEKYNEEIKKLEDHITNIESISNHNYETANKNAEVAQENAKNYYEMTRAYNSLCQFGKLAEELGIDTKKHNAELPENKYKGWKFDVGQEVSETGKVTSYMSLTNPNAKKKKEVK